MNQMLQNATNFTIVSVPYYDSYNECYKNILMVTSEPQGPLRNFVTRVNNLDKLTTYPRVRYQDNPCNTRRQCGLAIVNPTLGCSNVGGYYNPYSRGKGKCGDPYMTPNDIPTLTTFLLSNGYQIETQITKMFLQSPVKFDNGKVVMSVTYYGNNPVNVTYMR
jgi:hypothetical protein